MVYVFTYMSVVYSSTDALSKLIIHSQTPTVAQAKFENG